MPSGHVFVSFENPIERKMHNLLLKLKKLSPQNDETMKKNLFHSKSTQSFVWTHRNGFENPTKSILHIAQKLWITFFGKKFFPRKILLDIQNLVLRTLRRRFASGPEKFCWKSEKDEVNCVFEKCFTFPQIGTSEI